MTYLKAPDFSGEIKAFRGAAHFILRWVFGLHTVNPTLKSCTFLAGRAGEYLWYLRGFRVF